MSVSKFENKTLPSGEVVKEATIYGAKLKWIADEPRLNENGTSWRSCTIEFESAKGLVTRQACMYENNFQLGVEIGGSYRATVQKRTGKTPFIQVSHLASAISASDDDFDYSGVEETAKADMSV